jgi:hypothetical protein
VNINARDPLQKLLKVLFAVLLFDGLEALKLTDFIDVIDLRSAP